MIASHMGSNHRTRIFTLQARTTLLGTGGPRPDPNRHGSAVTIQIGSDCLLFDAGRGVTTKLPGLGFNHKESSSYLAKSEIYTPDEALIARHILTPPSTAGRSAAQATAFLFRVFTRCCQTPIWGNLPMTSEENHPSTMTFVTNILSF